MRQDHSGPNERGSKAAVGIGIVFIIAGLILGLGSLLENTSTGTHPLILLIIPAFALGKLGVVIFFVNGEKAEESDRTLDSQHPKFNVQDFVHSNKARNNVTYWEKRRAETIGRPQRKIQSWSLRLMR